MSVSNFFVQNVYVTSILFVGFAGINLAHYSVLVLNLMKETYVLLVPRLLSFIILILNIIVIYRIVYEVVEIVLHCTCMYLDIRHFVFLYLLMYVKVNDH